MEEIMQIVKDLDWSPLFISLKTGVVATFISFFLGIFAARKVVKATPGKKAVIDGILTLPMVLPPTVAGFFLLLLFSRRRPLGEFLFEQFDFKVVQTWLGCVIAATVIAFPLIVQKCPRGHGADRHEPCLCGAYTWHVGHKDILDWSLCRLAGPGIASGTILTFARALGEYGCYFHAGRKYTGQDRRPFRRRSPWSFRTETTSPPNLGGGCDDYCISCDLPDEPYIRKRR